MKGNLRLYRGLRAADFALGDKAGAGRRDSIWRAIVEHRQKSGQYPAHLNRDIVWLQNQPGLRRQTFSDRRQTAERYLGQTGGLIAELDVPLDHVLRYFELEIQNYAKRKSKFEVVYTVRPDVLARQAGAWKLQLVRLDPEARPGASL